MGLISIESQRLKANLLEIEKQQRMQLAFEYQPKEIMI